MTKILRLLHIIQDIRLNPGQSLENMLETHKISRTQFYYDKKTLADLGFKFEYRTGSGFQIMEDRLSPITDLSLSDRIILLFALESLCATGDGVLAAKALEVGRKLAGALEKPFCEQMLECFDSEVIEKTYGVTPEIFQQLLTAVRERSRVRILYYRSGSWTEKWRTVDPKRIYMRERTLYLYARTVDDTPPDWKVFRLNRIRAIEPTGISFSPNPDDDDGFCRKIKNAFSAFLGDNPRKITVKFTGNVIPYVREAMWHPSQVLEDQPDGSLYFSVCVAEPEEVVRWSQQFGENAQVLEIEPDDTCVLERKKK